MIGLFQSPVSPLARSGLAGVIVPLARLEAALVDQLPLRQELVGDLGQPVPRDARVVLGPLVLPPRYSFVAIVKVVKVAVLPTCGSLLTQNRMSARVHVFGK
jgi:hypothetical protein